MNCTSCNNPIPADLKECPNCGCQIVSPKSNLCCLILVLFTLIGFSGVHRFYVGKIISGLVQLLTLGLFGIWAIIDIIMIICGKFTDSQGRKITWSGIPVQLNTNFTPQGNQSACQSQNRSFTQPAGNQTVQCLGSQTQQTCQFGVGNNFPSGSANNTSANVTSGQPNSFSDSVISALQRNANRVPVHPREMIVHYFPVANEVIEKYCSKFASKVGFNPAAEQVLFATEFVQDAFMITNQALYVFGRKPTTVLNSNLAGRLKERIPLCSILNIEFEAASDAFSSGAISIFINGQELGTIVLPIPTLSWLKYSLDRETPCKEAATYFTRLLQ